MPARRAIMGTRRSDRFRDVNSRRRYADQARSGHDSRDDRSMAGIAPAYFGGMQTQLDNAPRLREVLSDGFWQARDIDGLGYIAVASSFQGFLFVTYHRECGDCHHYNIFR